MHGDHFLALIPPQSIRIEKMQSSAWEAVAKIRPEYIEAIDKRIWLMWSKVQQVLRYTESSKENAFTSS